MILANRNRFAKVLTKFGVVLLSCVFGLTIVEIGLRLFWHPQLTVWQSNLNTTIPIDPKVIRGVAGPSHVSTNSMGIRGEEWSNDRSKEYRILAIGGSTAECLLNDQPNTWTALLQTRIATIGGRKVWVGNAGHGGFNSRQAVLEMRYMLDQYQPDAVVVLVGGNDVGLMLSEGQGYDPNFIDNPDKMRDLAMASFLEKPVAVLKHRTAAPLKNLYLYMMLRETLRRLTQSPRGFVNDVETYDRFMEMRRHPWLVVNEVPYDLQPGLNGYAHNIREINRLAKEHHVRLIFLTNPTFYQPNMNQQMLNQVWAGWLGEPSLNIYWSPEVLSTLNDAHNTTLIETCQKEGIECLDVAARLPKTLDVFFDQSHFTDYGCSLIADMLVNYFDNTPGAPAQK